ncbi:MAG: 50S ribosomal protein L9 [Armatimonadota bacterium]
MKIILTEEVIGLGEPGTIVDVAPGYARNFLVPRKLAVYANSASAKEMEHHRKRLDRKRERLQDAAKTTVGRINDQTVTIDTRAGKDGKLYGSITMSDVAAAIEAQLGVTVDRRKIQTSEPIRSLGTHPVEVRLIGDARATVNVTVVDTTHPVEKPEPAPAPEAAAPAEPAPVAVEEETSEEAGE